MPQTNSKDTAQPPAQRVFGGRDTRFLTPCKPLQRFKLPDVAADTQQVRRGRFEISEAGRSELPRREGRVRNTNPRPAPARRSRGGERMRRGREAASRTPPARWTPASPSGRGAGADLPTQPPAGGAQLGGGLREPAARRGRGAD